MVEINSKESVIFLKNPALSNIVNTHLNFMKQFSMDDNISYSVTIVFSRFEARTFTHKVPDSVNITGNYFEETFIDDESVKVVIVDKKYIDCEIEKYLDESS
ncbi:MAG: hypothetical protein ACI4GY_10025 [Acutalibacteraceae bacterium]